MNKLDYLRKRLDKFKGVIPYDDFSEIASSLALQFNIELVEASNFITNNLGDRIVGTQEYSTHGLSRDNLWPGQNEVVNFSKTDPGQLAEPLAKMASQDLEAIREKLEEVLTKHAERMWGKSKANPFAWVVNGAAPMWINRFLTVYDKMIVDAPQYGDQSVFAKELNINPGRLTDLMYGRKEKALAGRPQIPNLMQFLNEIPEWGPLQKMAFKEGDRVRVNKNDEAPWSAEYRGVIIKINPDNTADILDENKVIQQNQRFELLSDPMAEGRPTAPPQYRRVGDNYGLMDGPGDIGDPHYTREHPGLYQKPRGHETDNVVNPHSPYSMRKEATLYEYLLRKIVKDYGRKVADKSDAYLKGASTTPPPELRLVLRQYGLERLA